MASTPGLTPLMKQYNDLKAKAGSALLLFRMGDFYELFGDDAVVAARILEITLTSRDKNKDNALPMAGVPHHAAPNYIQRLLKAGYKVAIGEQMEDPSSAKGIVRRDITRVFSPAVNFDPDTKDPQYLAVFVKVPDTEFLRLCVLEPTTGELRVSDPNTLDGILDEALALNIRHVLDLSAPGQETLESTLSKKQGLLWEKLPKNYLSFEAAESALKSALGTEDLMAFSKAPEERFGLGVLVHAVAKSQGLERLPHVQPPRPLRVTGTLRLSGAAQAHLDLEPLFELINSTRSSLGTRTLKRWLQAPLTEAAAISARQEAVREFAAFPSMARAMRESLSQAYDLERIAGRLATRLASPRDTLAAARTVALIPALLQPLLGAQAKTLVGLRERLNRLARELSGLCEDTRKIQIEPAPHTTRDGGIFGRGVTPALDEMIDLSENGTEWLIQYETRERESTGIASLKVKYNRVFGYSIEITKTHLEKVPGHYIRKQSMAGAERFFTEELKTFEDKILSASSRKIALEQELFEALVARWQAVLPQLADLSSAYGELETLAALGHLADRPGWVFPVIDESFDLELKASRHPLVDEALKGGFVPNDVNLNSQTRTLLITGPNMGGKSTVMRQVAILVILGQMGAPVPAVSARWGRVESLFTRIGAHDAIAQGQSTFMVEMSELAEILHHANERSLIVLDEIGRGTSTYDGMSVAWATLEWICRHTKARTFFATHYHELTGLESELPLLSNAHMAVASQGRHGIRFLYVLKPGAVNDSFGIQVAKMAGLPAPVIARAWEVLEDLEQSHSRGAHQTHVVVNPNQLSLWAAPSPSESAPENETEREVLESLRDMNINALTPLQALQTLAGLTTKLKDEPSDARAST